MATKATASDSTAARRPAAINLDDLPALIERADDLVALIARNRAARAGLGKTGRAVLRDHERMLSAELAGIRELASHVVADTPDEAMFLLLLAAVDLREARARANAHADADLVALVERLQRLLLGAVDNPGDRSALLGRLGEHLAPLAASPHSRAALAMTQIAAVEASNG